MSIKTLTTCLKRGDVVEARKILNECIAPDFRTPNVEKIYGNCPTNDPVNYAQTLKLMLDISSFSDEYEPFTFSYSSCENFPKVSKDSSVYEFVKLLRSTERVEKSMKSFRDTDDYNRFINIDITIEGNFNVNAKNYKVDLSIYKEKHGRSSIIPISVDYFNHIQILSVFEILFEQQFDF